jgi:acetyl-CoA acetyltransferase
MTRGEQVAIVGIGCSDFSRESEVGPGTHIARAARAALLDSGVNKGDVDGVVGVFSTDSPTLAPGYIVEALALPNVRWADTTMPPSVAALSCAAQAISSGTCDYVVCYHGKYRWADTSTAGHGNPLRQAPPHEFDPLLTNALLEHAGSLLWAARVMQQHMSAYGSTREDFGRISVNNRTGAIQNPRAVFRKPLRIDDYLAAPLVDAPICLLDCDVPVDGAIAVVLTTAERARDLPNKSVVIDGFGGSLPPHNNGLIWPEADAIAARAAVADLFHRSEFTPADMDICYPYDGFTIMTMLWLEALYTAPGEGPALVRDSWVETEQRLELFGRVRVNTHGGNLSEGRATQGLGGIYEAVQQLRGQAGPRQVPGAQTAVVTNGNSLTNRSTVLVAT